MIEQVLRDVLAKRRAYIVAQLTAEGAETPPTLLAEFKFLDDLQTEISSAAKKAKIRDPFEE